VLLSAVRSRDLLAGKVLGIGACGLGQMFIAVAAGLIANAAVHRTHIPSTVWALLPAVLLWFLLGYALYAFAFAAAGALVARQEEVQLVTTPFASLLILGYLLTYAAVASPDALWLRILSFFPPVAPMLMPARIALGHVAPWETPVAVSITVVFIVGASRIAGFVYTAGLTRSGPRLSWRQALHRRGQTAIGLTEA
jgi:ABC-2 type transport system permease protein